MAARQNDVPMQNDGDPEVNRSQIIDKLLPPASIIDGLSENQEADATEQNFCVTRSPSSLWQK